MDATLQRYVWLYNQQLQQSASGSTLASDEEMAQTQASNVQETAILPAGM